MKKIVVYVKRSCVQCDATLRHLGSLGLSYETMEATENIEHLKALGYLSAPVVVAGDESWSGYRPDLLNSLVK